ncbi:hypothetical protein [Megalodesulfovibrio paquesii]
MTRRLLHFPGQGCHYYWNGRCLLEERRNPGLEQAWRCRVLLAWGEAYDHFLDQAEVFALADETAMGIWRQRMKKLGHPRLWCGEYVLAPDGDDLPDLPPGISPEDVATVGCLHQLEDMCLKELPACAGVCAHFEPRRDHDAAEDEDAP